jgi:hypothetical protein
MPAPHKKAKTLSQKASLKRERQFKREGQTPLDFLLEVMRNPKKRLEYRLEAAKAAAPYVHPKLSIIKNIGSENDPAVEALANENFRKFVGILGDIARAKQALGPEQAKLVGNSSPRTIDAE